MARIIIEAPAIELVAGFVVGVEYVNDGAIEIHFDRNANRVVLEDADANEDRHYQLTVDGLEAVSPR